MSIMPQDPDSKLDPPDRPGAWLREEMRRAAERAASLPAYARPTVTRPFGGGRR